jgi:two-component system, OmpR family, KDP operon response regulator KdpE
MRCGAFSAQPKMGGDCSLVGQVESALEHFASKKRIAAVGFMTFIFFLPWTRLDLLWACGESATVKKCHPVRADIQTERFRKGECDVNSWRMARIGIMAAVVGATAADFVCYGADRFSERHSRPLSALSKVLIIDAEAGIRGVLRAGFERDGFSVLDAATAAAGLRAATMSKPDLIVLDLDLTDLDGAEVLTRIRSWSNVPVIVLSIRSDERHKVRLLKLGADDYIVKPFGIAELLARAEAALRRNLRGTNREPVVRAGPLAADLVSRAVTLDGKRVQLTRKEYALLHGLATHIGLVVTHQQLIGEIWGAHAGNIQYLRILVRKLRQKIEADPSRPSLIVSESGVGYRLDPGKDSGAPDRQAVPDPTSCA